MKVYSIFLKIIQILIYFCEKYLKLGKLDALNIHNTLNEYTDNVYRIARLLANKRIYEKEVFQFCKEQNISEKSFRRIFDNKIHNVASIRYYAVKNRKKCSN